MSSAKLSPPFSPETRESLVKALVTVAERSFFAFAEACDRPRFDELSQTAAAWIIATVRFEEAECEGVVSCTLPEELALELFDAFTGRDPSGPMPEAESVFDLIGELANMVCGLWLTRLTSNHTFTLAKPSAQRVTARPAVPPPGGDWMLATVNDQPIALDAWMQPVSAGARV